MNDNCPAGSDYDIGAPWKQPIPKEKEIDITLKVKVIATIKAYDDAVKKYFRRNKCFKNYVKDSYRKIINLIKI